MGAEPLHAPVKLPELELFLGLEIVQEHENNVIIQVLECKWRVSF